MNNLADEKISEKIIDPIQKSINLNITHDVTSSSISDYTIAGLDELLLQITEKNTIGYLNEKMARLLGASKKSQAINTDLILWDKGPLGDNFIKSMVDSARKSNQTIIMEHKANNVGSKFLDMEQAALLSESVRLRFVCTPLKGRVQIVAQDITKSHWLEETFSRYLSPNVISQLRNIPEEELLKTEKRVVTILFADLRGFTSLCQKESSKNISELINEFLTNMVNCIEKYDGMVDKFIGDEVMAVFGAPIKKDDHALKALLTAREMKK